MTDTPPHSPVSAPQVRTLLLTDLCESTTLVERLGDALAAALFREHDRLVLELQQRWRGRLIDRSDGLLLLFERPIDGLGFALDYMRGLHELGQARKLRLQARAGLHVGEVLTWQNSDEAVRAGAKSLEVEGIAKPLAGRLMSLARPGQILLSAVAEPMSHRAASELGERGKHLVWKSYGRWRFKGVPTAQEIHEVGEPGLAALRMPKHTAKAWRDIPLWRRPVALAAELTLVAGLGLGAWFLTRSPPAIAFNERDWVVVGDLRNLTGQPVLDESLEQAFRISLEQSRYVNVLSDLKVRDTLALMKRKPGEPLDRATASEVALRDGARAVILPTVAEVGGRVRVSAEVVDPHTQTTVYAESADGSGAASALESIDKVTGELRNKLGEAVKSIERDSAPLPQVSTNNLDALKAYALGEKKHAEGDALEALAYFRRALELDPNFALAQVAYGRVQISQEDTAAGVRNVEKGARMRDHLSTREAMTADALLARFGPVPPLLVRWQQLLEMYPDAHNAQLGYAQDGWLLANKFEPMLPHAKAATVSQFAYRGAAEYLQGILLLGDERYAEAIRSFENARQTGFKGEGVMHAAAYLAQRQNAKADAIFAARGGSSATPEGLDTASYQFLTSVDRGRWREAIAISGESLGKTQAAKLEFDESKWRFWKLSADWIGGKASKAEIGRGLEQTLQWLRSHSKSMDSVYAPASFEATLAAGYLAAMTRDRDALAKALSQLPKDMKPSDYPVSEQMRQVLLAESDRLAGNPGMAAQRLRAITSRPDGLGLAHSAALRAYRDDGNAAEALIQAQWLAQHRGRAFAERTLSDLLDPVLIADTTLARLDSAELLTQLGRKQEAMRELRAFLAGWPKDRLPAGLRARVEALTAQSA